MRSEGVKGAGFIAAIEIMPKGPPLQVQGALFLLRTLLAACSLLPAMLGCWSPLLGPWNFLACPLNCPLLLDFLGTDTAFLFHTHKHTYLHTFLSHLLLAFPSPGLQPLNLEPGFNMLHAFLFPTSPSRLSCF